MKEVLYFMMYQLKLYGVCALIAFAAFLFTLFCNKYYNAFYTVFGNYLAPVFIVFCNVIPSLVLFLPKQNKKTKKKEHV